MEGQRNCTHGIASNTHPALLFQNPRLSSLTHQSTVINNISSLEGLTGQEEKKEYIVLASITGPKFLCVLSANRLDSDKKKCYINKSFQQIEKRGEKKEESSIL